MFLITVGLSHKTAPIELREKLALLAYTKPIQGAIVVSTCNRTEIYFEARDKNLVMRQLWQAGVKLTDLKQYTYMYHDYAAVQHLMQVASGLDSMVLGEVEIVGQLKVAYQKALSSGLVSKTLGRLFQKAFATAKTVRTETEIGLNPVSVAYLAVRLAERIFAKINGKTVFIIGAGHTAKLLLKYLKNNGAACFLIANRTLKNSLEMVQDLEIAANLEYLNLSDVADNLYRADIVITATASPLPLLGKGLVEQSIKRRKRKPMFMVDLSVPRNIESQVASISDVYLYGIDDLQEIAAEHTRSRLSAVQQAEQIIVKEARKFMLWLESLQATSTIQAFRELCEAQRDEALGQALKQLQSGKDPEYVLRRFAHVMLNRLIHHPTVVLREVGGGQGNTEFIGLVRKLFKIGIEQENERINSG